MNPGARLSRWWASRHEAWDDGRWLVLDVEASGLDAARDRLLAVAAIAVHIEGGRARIMPGDSFEVVLKQDDGAARPDKANILLHGIGVGAQRTGVAPREALAAFAAFAGRSPLVAFHAAFDRTLIERGFRSTFGAWPGNPWLDLAPLAAVLNPEVTARALDEWMAHFGVRCAVRHQAAADAMATAELLLMLWPRLATELRVPGFRSVCRLAARHRWLQR